MSVWDMIELVSSSDAPGAGPRVDGGGGRCTGDVQAEVATALVGWTATLAPPAARPVVSAFPLKSPDPTGSGPRYTVIATWRDGEAVRHRCCLVTEEEYARHGYNPYRLLEGAGSAAMSDAAGAAELAEGPLTPEIGGLVVEGLQQLLARGELHLPLSQPDEASRRIVACLIAAIPLRTRAGLRFTSFCPGEPWLWNLAVVHQPGGSLVDWKRRVSNLLGDEPGPAATAYLRSVTGRLGIGDVLGLEELARTTRYQPSLEPGRRTIDPAAASMQDSAPKPPRPVPRPASTQGTSARISAAGRVASDKGLDDPPRQRRKIVLERRRLRPIAMPDTRRSRRLSGRAVSVLVFLGVMLGGWFLGGIPGLSVRSLAERLIPAWGDKEQEPRETPLLAVVDVGRVYDSVRTRYQGRMLAADSGADAARDEALVALERGASRPLASQVSTYLDVVAGGIRQVSQPEREIRRLDALVAEGTDLGGDLARLELAWYSLAERVFWQDLSILQDRAVEARCDSLSTARPQWRLRAVQALNIADLSVHQRRAVTAAGAMSRLLTLFRATAWSPEWQTQLQAAAEDVPPAASSVTRAYRNSAFALVRLKAAEHAEASLALPYGGGWSRGGWPSAEVRKCLPALRRTAGRFRQGRAPRIVAGTVEIYALLDDSGAAARRAGDDPAYWRDLNGNPAVAFDPAVFEDVLGRLRFEALRPYLDRGDPPAAWPAHLTTMAAAPGIQQFYGMLATSTSNAGWSSFAADVTDPFMKRWAKHLALAYGAAARDQLVAFSAAWERMTAAAADVRSRAAEGRDWSAGWRTLQDATLDLLDRYVLAFGDNPVCRAQVAAAANLLTVMNEPVKVHLTSAAVRLEAVPPGPDLVLEAVVMPEMARVRTPLPVLAPGRKVVTVPLDWNLDWAPTSWVVFRVLSGATGDVVLEAVCPSLQEQAGPSALARPLETEAGSLDFRFDAGVWRQLEIPDLGAVF